MDQARPLSILSLNLDAHILDPQSAVAARERAIGSSVHTYTLLIPHRKDTETRLGESSVAYGIGGIMKPVQLVRIYRKVGELIRASHYDVITAADNYYLALLGWYIARRYHLGFEVQVHGFEKFSGVRAFIAKWVMPRTGAVRVASSRLKDLLVTQFGVPEDRITVAPLFSELIAIAHSDGEQTHSVQLASQVVRQKGSDFVFLTVSRLVPVKNITIQLTAFKRLLARHPDTQLWVVGNGPERLFLEKKARKLGISDRVRFWGWQADTSAFYTYADSFLLSSGSEGWGLVVVEAAAHRLPILMTDVGCAGEFIHDGENGLVVPVGGREAFAEGMERLRTDAALREALSAAAKDSLASLPSREALMQRYVESWERARA